MTKTDDPNVMFEHWFDPYDPEHMTFEDESGAEFLDEEDELDDEDLEGFMDLSQFMKPMKMILTQFGPLPLTEQSLASKHFKFWVGHANFKITTDFYPMIGKVLGVETLEAMTPYRFKIGIGKLFDDSEVIRAVRKAMIEYHQDITDGDEKKSSG